jgi:outer membrane protein assembly factor BamA
MTFVSRMLCSLFVAAGFFICTTSFAQTEPNAPQTSAALEQHIVGDIVITGNQNTTQSQVLSKLRTRVGDYFNAQTAAEDANRIAELPAVDYAYYNTAVVDEKIKLPYVIVEKLPVRAIQFVGNKEFGGRKLTKKLDFKRGD